MRGARHMENNSFAFKGAGFRYLKIVSNDL